jgi:hypothetical protein
MSFGGCMAREFDYTVAMVVSIRRASGWRLYVNHTTGKTYSVRQQMVVDVSSSWNGSGLYRIKMATVQLGTSSG